METMDHRTRVTKLLIRRAFTKLLREKPIQNITVKELCAHAGVNRGTFYAHYADIYALLEQIEREMYDELCEALEPLRSAGERELSPVEVSTEIFQCLKDNSDLCTVTLGDHGDKKFLLKLLDMGRKLCVESYSRYFGRGVSRREIEYYYAFVSEGCIGLLRRWMGEEMAAPAGEIARMAEGIMLRGIGFLERRDETAGGQETEHGQPGP